MFAVDIQRKIRNEIDNQLQNQKPGFGFSLHVSYFAIMAGGTSAFNMIQSFRDNMALKKSRRKMQENPYLGPKRESNAQKTQLNEGIQHRFATKKWLGNLRIAAFLCILALVLLGLLMLKILWSWAVSGQCLPWTRWSKTTLVFWKKRNRLKNNPYLPNSPEAEIRDPTHYPELMAHRFARRDFARRISFWTTIFIVSTILIALFFYFF